MAKKYGWEEQETDISARVGGRRQPRSGAGSWSKGDIIEDGGILLHEAKLSGKDSIRLQISTFHKIFHQARQHFKYPAVTVTFKVPGNTEHLWLFVPLDLVDSPLWDTEVEVSAKSFSLDFGSLPVRSPYMSLYRFVGDASRIMLGASKEWVLMPLSLQYKLSSGVYE